MKHFRLYTFILCIGVLSFALSLVFVSVAQANTIYVNSTDDVLDKTDNKCTLREAIINANDNDATYPDCNAGSGADTIRLPYGTIVLTKTGAGEDLAVTGDLDILDDLTIKGKGSCRSAVDGNETDRVFQVIGDITAKFKHMTIKNGLESTGGGIRTATGNVTINKSILKDNATVSSSGGGIETSTGDVTVYRSFILNNTAETNGGGIRSDEGNVKVDKSLIMKNTATTGDGGGIWTVSGDVEVGKSLIIKNTAGIDGGGIFTDTGTVTVEKSIVAGNNPNNIVEGPP